MNANITSLYAAAIAVLMTVLSTRVATLRGKHGVALGDGGLSGFLIAQCRSGILSEHAALILLLMLLLELQGVAAIWLHLYGTTFLAFRLTRSILLF
jgi:uncharacterized membrane protein YecN with MAPEG domain